MLLVEVFSFKHSGCLSPGYVRTKGGNALLSSTPKYQIVPCGKCAPCLNRKRNQWSFRLIQEAKVSSSAFFVTLTYDDDHLIYDFRSRRPVVCKRHIQLFFKRLRKRIAPSKVRYYLVSEYGGKTRRPHYHAILFNLPCTAKEDLQSLLVGSWQYGFVHVDDCNESTIAYTTKYCITSHNVDYDVEPVFSLMSKRPALGSNYLETHRKFGRGSDKYYAILPGGAKVALPRYYRERLFTERSRRQYARECSPPPPTSEDVERWKKRHRTNPYESVSRSAVQYNDLTLSRINKLDKL